MTGMETGEEKLIRESERQHFWLFLWDRGCCQYICLALHPIFGDKHKLYIFEMSVSLS